MSRPTLQEAKQACAIACELLQRVSNGEPYTFRDLDNAMERLRAVFCDACRNGKPHRPGDEHDY